MNSNTSSSPTIRIPAQDPTEPYILLINLPQAVLNCMLSIFNGIWTQNIFPTRWKCNSCSYSETRKNLNEPKQLPTDSIIKHYVQINGENYKLQTPMVP